MRYPTAGRTYRNSGSEDNTVYVGQLCLTVNIGQIKCVCWLSPFYPGIIFTELCSSLNLWQRLLFMPFAKLFFVDPERGSQTTLYCALQEGIETLSGRYFSNCALQQVGVKARDDALAKKLWEVSERIVSLNPNAELL